MFSDGQRLALDTAHLGAVADDMLIQALKGVYNIQRLMKETRI